MSELGRRQKEAKASILVTENILNVDKPAIREKILDFEDVLSEHPNAFFGDSDNCPLTHNFSNGIYVREIFIPKGTTLTGKIHKHSHPNFLMSGTVDVITETGGRERLVAPMSMISAAGTKRVVHAITDVTWITVHRTDETDLEKIEEETIAPTYEDYEKFKRQIGDKSIWNRISTFVNKQFKISTK